MSDTEDRESRTEEATEKRISEAIEKGNVPFAREATLFGSIAGILACGLLLGSWATSKLTVVLQTILVSAGTLRLDDREAAASLVTALLAATSEAVLPLIGVIAGGAVIASVAQNVPSLASERVRPQASRISLIAGWGRLFGKAGLVEFFKSLLKLVTAATLTILVLRDQTSDLLVVLFGDPRLVPRTILDFLTHFLMLMLVFSLLLALGDLAWSRFKWRRGLRMTRHEIKEEMKQSEGDPHIRARIRTIARQRSSRRMLKKLPQASMVIANPTHYAVALRYARDEGGAPVVVAKGADFLALKIRAIAAEHSVPVIENIPLARALYDKVEIDTQIPPEFYRAIAEIIHFLHSRRRLPRHTLTN